MTVFLVTVFFLALLGIAASLATGIYFAVKKHLRGTLICVGVLIFSILAAGGSLVLLLGLGVASVARNAATVSAAARQERAEKIEYLESNLPEDARQSIPKDFYTYSGFRDWWRFPLVYPYEMHVIDDFEDGAYLGLYKGSGPISNPNVSLETLIQNVSELAYDNQMLLLHC